MSNEKVRKYVIPNLPYLLIFWLFCKLGEAYRLADGTDEIHKIIESMTTLNEAIANPFPSFNPDDLFVGVLGAIAIYLIVYFRKKNAKKFRKDVEYGSARWGAY